ncbi:MAG: hypothetical protein OEZ06_12770 [Myxococcales bacterium]|nr:hypothetical protein [Myxococcales bacterium]
MKLCTISVWIALLALVIGCAADSGSTRKSGSSQASGQSGEFNNPETDAISGGGAGSFGDGPVAPGGSGTAGTSVFDQPNCGAVQITPRVEFSPGNILVVFDRSGSMEDTDFNGMQRFAAANAALVAAVEPYTCPAGAADPDGMACHDPLTLATILFPSGLTLLCDPVLPFEQPPNISWLKSTEWLPTWQQFGSNPNFGIGTPIEFAFMEADRVLTDYIDQLEGSTAILFLTDGGSTCVPGLLTPDGTGVVADAFQIATKWAGQGVRTHVVSVQPGGSAYNDQLAAAGQGTSINPENPQDLEAAFASIIQGTASVASCDITLEGGRITDLDGACQMGTVLLGPNPLDCDPANGFSVTGESSISLHGSACDGLMDGRSLTATFPCGVVGPE